MDAKIEKLLRDLDEARALETQPTLNQKQIAVQLRALRTPGGFNARRYVDYVEKGLVPAPVEGRHGGHGVEKRGPRETAAEWDASVRLANHAKLSDVRETRHLALILESCRDWREVLGHRASFRDKERFAQMVASWLCLKFTNLKFLYDEFPKERRDYFCSPGFALLVFGLCYSAYDDLTGEIDAAGKPVRVQDRHDVSLDSVMTAFPTESTAMAAGARG